MDIDTASAIRLTGTDIAQMHAAIIGMTNSGKTNTLSVLVEELSAEGTKVTVVDPEGDYGSLRQGTRALIAGRGRKGNHIDIELTPDNAAAAADVLCRYDVPVVILDLSGFQIDVRDEFVLAYVGQLWKNYQEEDFPVHRLIVDEVQLFAPQSRQSQSKDLLRDMMARSRKRNFTLAIATQRPQSVDKGLLDQTAIRIFHHVAKGAALKAIKDLLPGNLPNPDELVAGLSTGSAVFMVDNTAKTIKVRPSRTFHPSDVQNALPTQSPLDFDKIAHLIGANKIADDIKADVKREVEEDACIEELKAENALLRAENQRLTNELAGIGYAKKGDAYVPPTPPVLPEVQVRDEQRQTRAEQMELERQTRGWRNLMLVVSRQSKLHRQIVSFLADHDPAEYNARDLGIAVGLSVNTHYSLSALLKSKLIVCRKIGGKYLYSTGLLKQVEEHYPLIGRAQAIEDIAKQAMK